MNSYAYQAYRNTQVATASQGTLILMLFDGAIKFAKQAVRCIEQSDFADANEKLLRSQDIMSELMSSLDMDVGEISDNLYQLYSFIVQLLIKANVDKDTKVINQAVDLLRELRDMWREVVENI